MPGKKKLLIITYYWPPSGGGGVQRWLKFARYLPDYDWEPIVFTPQNPEVPVKDQSLLSDISEKLKVIKIPIWEPYSLYKKFTGRKQADSVNTGFLSEHKSAGLAEKLSIWLRGNLFIPDARVFWVKPAQKYLLNYLKDSPVDMIVTSGPPHSMHLIGQKLKEKTAIPWVADFRDPWTNIDYYSQLMLSKWADKKHHKLEKSVLSSASAVLTVSTNWANDFKASGAKKTAVITNGYDEEDFKLPEKPEVDRAFSISHIGYMNKDRNPVKLWESLRTLCDKIEGFRENLRLRFIGKTDYQIFEALEKLGLSDRVEKVDYLPHKEVISEYYKSGILLLMLNNTPDAPGRIPGKLFEYMAAKRPVLCIGVPDGDAARIINETKCGQTAAFDDTAQMLSILEAFYKDYLKNKLAVENSNTEQFERKQLTAKLAKLFNELSKSILS